MSFSRVFLSLTLENVDGAPLADAYRDPEVPTINIKNVDGGPPERC
jgi:hypothetical protein